MLLRIEHETKLTYSAPVTEHVIEARMAPLSDEDQTSLGYRLRVTPITPITPYRDGFGNRVDLFDLFGQCDAVTVRATSYVRTHRRPGQARLAEIPWPGESPIALEALEFLQPSPLVNRCAQLDDFLASLPAGTGSIADGVRQLMDAVRQRLKYEKTVTTAHTPVGEALDLGRGVCQDFAHLFIGACRGRGVPARYVSGYVHQPGELATHAWLQVWGGPAAGWVDIDPTHDRYGDDDYVVTAVGRDYSDVPPNRGAWKGHSDEAIAVSVQVEKAMRLPSDWTELEPRPARSRQVQSAAPRAVRGQGLSNQTIGRPTLRHQKSQQQQ